MSHPTVKLWRLARISYAVCSTTLFLYGLLFFIFPQTALAVMPTGLKLTTSCGGLCPTAIYMNAWTDKDIYAPGETMIVTGQVTSDDSPTTNCVVENVGVDGANYQYIFNDCVPASEGTFQDGVERQINYVLPANITSGTHTFNLAGSASGYAGKNSQTTFTVSAPTNYSLNVSRSGSGSGTVTGTSINCGSTCSASYANGASVTLTATPSSGSVFSGWSGDCSGSSATCALTMSATRNVTAIFTSTSGSTSPGQCASTHYNCTSGTPQSFSEDSSAYYWQCGGSPTAICTEYKFSGGYLPDLITQLTNNQWSPLVTPSSPTAGSPVTIKATIINQQYGDAGSSLTQFWYSNNGGSSYVSMGKVSTPAIAASFSQAVTLSSATGFPSPGTYYIRACADSDGYIQETIENNNCATYATPITVQPGNPPACSSAAPSAAVTLAQSGTFYVYAYGVTGATAVKFAVWGEDGGQDDLHWYIPTSEVTDMGGGTWRAAVNLGNHKLGNPEFGLFNVHVYMDGGGYSDVWCGSANFNREQNVPVVTLSGDTALDAPQTAPATLSAYDHEAATMSWTATNGANSCTLYKAGAYAGGPYAYPSVASASTEQIATAEPATTDYTVTCTNGSASGTSPVLKFTVPPSPPTSGPGAPTATCNASGDQATLSWTLPSGYTETYVRAYKTPPAYIDWAAACSPQKFEPDGICETLGVGPRVMTVTPGAPYYWYFHTKAANGNWSAPVNGPQFTCSAAPITATCSVAPSSGTAGQTSFTWSATNVSGGVGSYTYSWSGTDGLSGSGSSVNKTYSSQGSKTGTVTITSGGSSQNFNCTTNVGGNSISVGPAAPTVDLTATPATIDQGQSSTLSWTSTDATSCTGTGFNSGGTTSGSVSTGALSPAGTYSYQMTCTGPGGTSPQDLAQVIVLAPNVSISANPPRVPSGQPTTITWSSLQVTSCSVSGPGLSSTLTSGSQSVPITTQSTYTITCQTNGSPITRSVVVNLLPSFQEF